MSAKLTGVPKSAAHKAAIAATLRRRAAAVRVLRAVEGVHRQHGAAMSTSGRGSLPTQNRDSADDPTGISSREGSSTWDRGSSSSSSSSGDDSGGASSRRIPASIAGSGLSGISSSGSKSRRLSKGQILNGYKEQLHEYRALKEELGPWTIAFAEKHNRKPRLVDVERTGVHTFWVVCNLALRATLLSAPSATASINCCDGTRIVLLTFDMFGAGLPRLLVREIPASQILERASLSAVLTDPWHAAGVDWLIQKYKLYIMLRERLLMETPHLRGSITKARSGPGSINDAGFGDKRGADTTLSPPNPPIPKCTADS